MAEKYRPLLKAINEDRARLYLDTPRFAAGGTVGASGVANYGDARNVQYASNHNYTTVNSGPSEVVLNGATLIVKDVNGQLIGRMQVPAHPGRRQVVSIAAPTWPPIHLAHDKPPLSAQAVGACSFSAVSASNK
jgi:hypothetical protein